MLPFKKKKVEKFPFNTERGLKHINKLQSL